MAVRIVWSPRAVQDLESIQSFIARDNPAAARSFVQSTRNQLDLLENFPQIGRMVPEARDPTVRELIFQSYRIVYRNDSKNKVVTVSRIWHAARGEPEIQP